MPLAITSLFLKAKETHAPQCVKSLGKTLVWALHFILKYYPRSHCPRLCMWVLEMRAWTTRKKYTDIKDHKMSAHISQSRKKTLPRRKKLHIANFSETYWKILVAISSHLTRTSNKAATRRISRGRSWFIIFEVLCW